MATIHTPIALTVKIGGYDVRLRGNERENGLLVPIEADLTDHDYVRALRQAQKLWPCLVAFRDIYYARRKPAEGMNKRECNHLLDAFDLLKHQTRFRINDATLLFELSIRDRLKTLEREQTRERNRAGYVYLIKSPTRYYKIGKTGNPDDRMRTFNVKLPFEVSYLCLIKTDDMHLLEKELHERFSSKRVNGEWFRLKKADIAYIMQLPGSTIMDAESVLAR